LAHCATTGAQKVLKFHRETQLHLCHIYITKLEAVNDYCGLCSIFIRASEHWGNDSSKAPTISFTVTPNPYLNENSKYLVVKPFISDI